MLTGCGVFLAILILSASGTVYMMGIIDLYLFGLLIGLSFVILVISSMLNIDDEESKVKNKTNGSKKRD